MTMINRYATILRGGEFRRALYSEIRKGDLFRLYESDGSPVAGGRVWTAVGDPDLDDIGKIDVVLAGRPEDADAALREVLAGERQRAEPADPIFAADQVIALGPCWSEEQIRALVGDGITLSAGLEMVRRGELEHVDAVWFLTELLTPPRRYLAAVEVAARASATTVRFDISTVADIGRRIRDAALRGDMRHKRDDDLFDAPLDLSLNPDVEVPVDVVCAAFSDLDIQSWTLQRLALWHRRGDELEAAHRRAAAGHRTQPSEWWIRAAARRSVEGFGDFGETDTYCGIDQPADPPGWMSSDPVLAAMVEQAVLDAAALVPELD